MTTTTKIKPRPYQVEALDGIHEQFKNSGSTLLVCATGLGKTICFCELAREYKAKGRVMILAHREELISQAYDKSLEVAECEPDIEMGEWHVQAFSEFQSAIVLSTIQTQIAGMAGKGRMTKFDPQDFSLLIIDEAHHSAAASYRRVIDYYRKNPKLKVLGVTATPDRADEAALGQIFETVAYEYGILEGIEDGWLVPIEQQSVYVDGLDYSEIRTCAGDLNGGDLARVMEFEDNLHRIVSPVIELCGDRKTLIFAASLAHAERITEILNRHKPDSAEFVYGKTPKDERRKLFPRYANGDFQFLVNVGVATEGFDEPGIEVVVMARPTKSRSLYAQMAGRGTRVLPGLIEDESGPEARKAVIRDSDKPCLEIIDFVGNSGRHKLMTSADILGGRYDDEIVTRAKHNAEKKSADSGLPVDVIEELDFAEEQLAREKREAVEAARRQHLKVRATYSSAKVNPFDVYDISPWREKAWHKSRQPTEKQVAMLDRNGVDVSGLTFTHASQLIGKIIKNREKKLCSFKQAACLTRYGYDAKQITFDEAKVLIDAIAQNGWKRPA